MLVFSDTRLSVPFTALLEESDSKSATVIFTSCSTECQFVIFVLQLWELNIFRYKKKKKKKKRNPLNPEVSVMYMNVIHCVEISWPFKAENP